MSSMLHTSARVYAQAVRNVNDGISFFNVADDAISSLKDILTRLSELSTQASNGTATDEQRQAMDKEAQALQAEYGRIVDTSTYNSMPVFSSGDVTIQAGYDPESAIMVNIGDAYTLTTTSFTTSTATTTTTTTTTMGNGTFRARQAYAPSSAPWSVAAYDVDGDSKLDLVVSDRRR